MSCQDRVGQRVKTVPGHEASDWTAEALATRRWYVKGEIIRYHDSHGITFEVRHDDGTIGHYEDHELVQI